MSKKRKHDQLQEQDDSKVTNSQPGETAQSPVSTDSTKSKAQLRQEKSERRARKQERSERRAKKQKKSKHEGKEHDLATSHAADKILESAPAADERCEEDPTDEPEVKSKKSKKRVKTQGEADEKISTPTRFIVFVGNLPYDVTIDQIKAHFSKISPTSVRLTTNKATGKSKGFAFLEFDHYDKMKTCLKLYHHSLFDPEAREKGKDVTSAAQDDEEQTGGGEKKKGRRINVELTAGGGGKSKERKDKIRSKNQKLEEERERRRLKEKAEKDSAGPKKHAPPETGANATEIKDSRGAIHPSRLSRVSH